MLNKHLTATARRRRIEKFGPVCFNLGKQLQKEKENLAYNRWTLPRYRRKVIQARIRFYESFTVRCVFPEFWCR